MASKEKEIDIYADDFDDETPKKQAAATAGGAGSAGSSAGGSGGVSSVASSLSTLPAGTSGSGGGGGGSVSNSIDTGISARPQPSTTDQKYVSTEQSPAPAAPDDGSGAATTDLHHFKVSINLLSVRGLPQRYEQMVCRYSYPLFGSSAPVTTAPPIPVPAYSEVLLNGYTGFEFIGSSQRLALDVAKNLLIVQILSKNRMKNDTYA